MRDGYTKLARQDDGLKVFKHYKLEHENGDEVKKKKVIENLKFLLEDRKQKDSTTQKLIHLKDDNAQTLLDELEPEKVGTTVPKNK